MVSEGFDIARSRSSDIKHHVDQGSGWLRSYAGSETVALSYAAFEFRLAIERMVIQLWRLTLDRPFDDGEVRRLADFKEVERQIYQLAGHQQTINRHFEFFSILLEMLKLPSLPSTPNLGKLSKFWHSCSELCHIGWTLACHSQDVRSTAHNMLVEAEEFLRLQAGGLTWPLVRDSDFEAVRLRYVGGGATADEVRDYLNRIGLYAIVDPADGRSNSFVGEAVPPTPQNTDGSSRRMGDGTEPT